MTWVPAGQFAIRTSPTIHLVCPHKTLHNFCFMYTLVVTVVPREIKDNACAKLRGGKQGVLREMWKWRIRSLCKGVSEQLTSTGSVGILNSWAALLGVISIIVNTLRNTNLLASRHMKMEMASLPVDLRSSRTLVLKLLRWRQLNTTTKQSHITFCSFSYFTLFKF